MKLTVPFSKKWSDIVVDATIDASTYDLTTNVHVYTVGVVAKSTSAAGYMKLVGYENSVAKIVARVMNGAANAYFELIKAKLLGELDCNGENVKSPVLTGSPKLGANLDCDSKYIVGIHMTTSADLWTCLDCHNNEIKDAVLSGTPKLDDDLDCQDNSLTNVAFSSPWFLVAKANTETSTNSTSYVTKKEFVKVTPGTFKVRLDMGNGDGVETISVKVEVVGGGAIELTSTSAGYEAKASAEFTAESEETIRVSIKTSDGGVAGYMKNVWLDKSHLATQTILDT